MESLDPQLIQELKEYSDIPEPVEIPHYPVIIPDPQYPAMAMGNATMRFWCQLNEDFQPELLSPINDYAHVVPVFIHECGLVDLFEWGTWPCNECEVTLAANYGLGYFQPFYVEACVEYTISGWPPEHDCDTSWEILHVVLLDRETISSQYYEWLTRSDQFNEIKNLFPTLFPG